MLKDINQLVDTDYMFEMELKRLPHSKPISQKDARKVIDLLGKVYLISHAIDCGACQRKYIKKVKK